MENSKQNFIYGRNPVIEALRAGADIERVLIQKNIEGAGKKIFALAKKAGVPLHIVDRRALDREAGAAAHQGVIAYVTDFEYADTDDMLASAAARGEKPFVVLLDGIEDPHNLGSIIRSADGAGAHGVVIRKNRAVQVTPAAVKTSAGAASHMPVARVANIGREIDYLKEKNIWVYGLDMDGDNYADMDYEGASALVIGSEGAGLSQLVREKCDYLISLPMRGKVASLNAGSAAAIAMYEITRKRTSGKGEEADGGDQAD
jgi:23S rRNA (guanosine2251-2'-O)-methyltransferase